MVILSNTTCFPRYRHSAISPLLPHCILSSLFLLLKIIPFQDSLWAVLRLAALPDPSVLISMSEHSFLCEFIVVRVTCNMLDSFVHCYMAHRFVLISPFSHLMSSPVHGLTPCNTAVFAWNNIKAILCKPSCCHIILSPSCLGTWYAAVPLLKYIG